MLWLARVGLGECGAAFRQHGVTGDLLGVIDDEMLRVDMHVGSKLLRAKIIARIKTLLATPGLQFRQKIDV